MSGSYDPLYIAFLHYFNVKRDYFECHEVMEQLWLEEGRDPFFQGLLQVAVGLYHHRNGNIDGGVKLLKAAVEKLEGNPQIMLGIDLGLLLIHANDHLAKLIRHHKEPFLFRDLDIEIVDPALAAAVERFRPEQE